MNREVSCKIGQALEYHAEVDGDPMPEITWYVEAETKSFFLVCFFTKETMVYLFLLLFLFLVILFFLSFLIFLCLFPSVSIGI